MSNWEERGIYGYAEEWFTNNGFDWKLKKSQRSKNIYTISKDGIEDEIEIPAGVTNPKKYMELVAYQFNLLVKIKAREAVEA